MTAVPDIARSEAFAEAAATYADAALGMAQGMVLYTADDEHRAVEHIRKMRTAVAMMIAERDKTAKPLQSILDSIKKRWKKPIDVYESAIKAIRERITTFNETRMETATAALQAAAAPAEVTAAVALAVDKAPGSYTTTRYSAEVVDLAQVPREYLVADTTKLNKLAREQKQAFAVPGCKLVVKKSTTVR